VGAEKIAIFASIKAARAPSLTSPAPQGREYKKSARHKAGHVGVAAMPRGMIFGTPGFAPGAAKLLTKKKRPARSRA